jgi:hypothetical protein
LNNNGNVFKVGLCYESPEYYFPTYADILIINLVDLSNGNPIGINSNGNVLTNNTLLNEIFETFNVKKMVQEYPTSVCCLDVYSIHFDGDIEELKNALDNLDSIIEYSFFKEVMMLLSNKSFEKLDIRIFPNPFQNNFTIETEKTITNYSLFDLTGKKIIETFSKNEIDNFSSQLNSGVYFLNLEFENGQKTNHKLIKE